MARLEVIVAYVVVNVTHPNVIGECELERSAINLAKSCHKATGDEYLVCPKRIFRG